MTDHKKADLSKPTSITSEHTIDEQRRRFLLHSVRIVGGVGALCAFAPFLASWNPSEKAKVAGGPVQVDLSHMQPGQQMTVAWRGKPIWIIRRTSAMLEQLRNHHDDLRDPDSRVPQQPSSSRNQYRSIKPEYLVLVGVCTHLGCTPLFKPNGETKRVLPDRDLAVTETPQLTGGFYCPCHGSRFDLAGRVYKGVPAPINLEVPPYRFLQEHVIEIGEI
ncbi:MAG: ubiquinol-cytochrome c reductase iron-sulfur subunit [Legionellaceae bacterium]|nr:ubiquinol-cytochrome c reductase iron-sulfur subunit [Legionellaceae bacterium]